MRYLHESINVFLARALAIFLRSFSLKCYEDCQSTVDIRGPHFHPHPPRVQPGTAPRATDMGGVISGGSSAKRDSNSEPP
jgi:hypothetical protein